MPLTLPTLIHPLATEFPADAEPIQEGLVALGGNVSPSMILSAYAQGAFPWTGDPPVPWFTPDPRMVLYPENVRITRSMRQTLQRRSFGVTMNTCFEAVIAACALVPRDGETGTWITENLMESWAELHDMGHAHSVEAWHGDELVGGLYGLNLGRVFFGESMFHLVSDASKVCLITLCQLLVEVGGVAIDCQQETEHLGRMGARPIPRAEYLELLANHSAVEAVLRGR